MTSEFRVFVFIAFMGGPLVCVIGMVVCRMVSAYINYRRLVVAAMRIHHWHDWGENGEGMIVSSESVRDLWEVLADIQ